MDICIVGNPVDGISVFGPFSDAEEALDWAEVTLRNKEWWIYTLIDPIKEGNE